jgi:glycosyltransferase involved in cell wall biosynthesis
MRPASEAAKAEIRRRYALPERFLLYLGGLDWRKNLTALLEAYSRSSQQAPLVLAGAALSANRALYPDLARFAEELDLSKNVRFLGPILEGDKAALYSAATAFIYPSLYEGFGLPPLEAMACGTPVICSDASSLPDVVGDAGLLVDAREVEALSAVIDRLLSDSPLQEELRARGLNRAALFSWDKVAEQTAAVYQAVLARNRASMRAGTAPNNGDKQAEWQHSIETRLLGTLPET